MNEKLEYKTYIFKPTGEFAQFDVHYFKTEAVELVDCCKIIACTGAVPVLYPVTHVRYYFIEYLTKCATEPIDFNWDDYELITIYLQR